MRLLTHNALRNNSADAKGNGYPLHITATRVSVLDDKVKEGKLDDEDEERRIAFVTGILGILDWDALVAASLQVGLSALPSKLAPELQNDKEFLKALYHVLMNVQVIEGTLTCPATQRKFKISDGIVNFLLEEEECEAVI
jgi:multifunctional methyltransferase subunit TRM112